VQDSPGLWEAAARWVSTTFFNRAFITILNTLSRDGCFKRSRIADFFRSEVDRIFAKLDGNWYGLGFVMQLLRPMFYIGSFFARRVSMNTDWRRRAKNWIKMAGNCRCWRRPCFDLTFEFGSRYLRTYIQYGVCAPFLTLHQKFFLTFIMPLFTALTSQLA
jgi:hypothetical protein